MDIGGLLSGVNSTPIAVIVNLLDICIVAYVVYSILKLMSNTRTMQIVRGLIILLGVYFLANYFEFQVLSWLMDKAWLMFTVALPIVFQSELRHLLEQLGENRWVTFHMGNQSQYQRVEKALNELVDMAQHLSQNKIGALVVLERNIRVDEYLDSGHDLDAIVSAPLLINIFEPNTPLHDGAVLIRDGRIARAACFMPLSQNTTIDPQLGTRHRAGIGITEVSDAVVVIVSEETGTISVARNGKLTRYLDPEVLASILCNEILGGALREEQPSGFRLGRIKRYLNEIHKDKGSET